MNIKNIIVLSLLISVCFFCSHPPKQSIPNTPDYEKQRLEILEKTQRSVLKITCSAYYDNYYYAKPKEKTATLELEKLLIKKEQTTNSVAGTGLIVSQNSQHNLVLSCFHLFDFQDTIKTYYSNIKGFPTRDLLSLSIKQGQQIYITHKNSKRTVGRIVANEPKNDIALIETKKLNGILNEQSFNGVFGKDDILKFGREVYLIGFPKGFLFVTRGLISPSPYKNKFLIDAPFNRGFSGGAVIAIEKKSGTYKYCGMANSMAYDSHLVLSPSENAINLKYYENMPYLDDAYVKELKLVNVGLTFVVKSKMILQFLKKEKEKLKLRGHYF